MKNEIEFSSSINKVEELKNNTKIKDENSYLKQEIKKLSSKLQQSETFLAQYGQTIIKLREQVENHHQEDVKDAMKQYENATNKTNVLKGNIKTTQGSIEVPRHNSSDTKQKLQSTHSTINVLDSPTSNNMDG